MSDNKATLFQDLKEYLKTELEIFKLNLLEKMARILTLIVGIIIASVLSLIAIAYFSVMLFDLFSQLTGSNFWATIIMIVLFLILSGLIIIFSEKLFLNFFVKKIYRVLFQSSDTVKEQPQNTESITQI